LTEATTDIACPQCGYDLRAIDSDRCPECGHAIDRAGLAQSRIPWTFRRPGGIGRWRAYWRTVALATWRGKQLAAEIDRPVEPRDARRFATVTALIASVPFALFFIATVIESGGTNFINPLAGIPGPSKRGGSGEELLPPMPDLNVPYAAGLTRWPVVPIAIVLFAWLATRAPRLWFRWGAPAATPQRRDRAEALSYYTCAPLVLAIPSILCILGGLGLMYLHPGSTGNEWDVITAIVVGSSLIVIAIIIWWFNVLRLLRRTVGAPMPRVLWTAVALPLSWYACGAIAFLAFPWVAGLLWLMIESVFLL
jgi:hypothetical protein